MEILTRARILVTGASGFVAAHLIHEFLSAGYNVRGTLRSHSYIPKIQAAQGGLSSHLTFAIIPDMSVPGAFDEAAKGVSGIIHSASPFILTPKITNPSYYSQLFEALSMFLRPQPKFQVCLESLLHPLSLLSWT